MRWRSIFATLLTVLLVALPSAMSVCEARCDLAGVAERCHVAGHPAKSHQAKGEMAGMQHSMMSPVDSEAMPAITFEPGACAHHVCTQQLYIRANQRTLAVRTAAVQFLHVAIGSTTTSRLQLREIPPLRMASPVSLHISLRI